ncbi:MAG: VapC toxin family PIN domain ribonuclease [Deltaproteobacteria bacterium HGW-Deltaproteobacteria-9]|nr:MAG: VapC toxin family PIN domain ribonuclease [Deltaproteobacteria bacterium HGW-Deltaproteobacteria-9]
MYYIDTSVIVAYYCPEPLAEKAEEFLSKIDRPNISSLTEVEFFSALSRKIRNKEIDAKTARKISAKFLAHLEGKYFHCVPVAANHYTLAGNWMSQFTLPLKSLDALHLAIASCEDFCIVTLDRHLYQNARKLDIEALLLDAF